MRASRQWGLRFANVVVALGRPLMPVNASTRGVAGCRNSRGDVVELDVEGIESIIKTVDTFALLEDLCKRGVKV